MLPVESPLELRTPKKIVEITKKIDEATKPETPVEVIMTVVEPEKE